MGQAHRTRSSLSSRWGKLWRGSDPPHLWLSRLVEKEHIMAEYWESAHIRGQQTLGVWATFAPDFTVGEVTLASHTADVAAILTRINDRDVQQDVVDLAAITRDSNYEFIHDVNMRAPQVIDANLPPDDDLHGELDDVFAVYPETQETNLERARLLVSLWTIVNEERAAMTPPLPALEVGGTTVAEFQTAVTNHPALLQTVADERAQLSQLKSQLSAHVRKVDRANKRWYQAWSNNFAAGSPEIDALSLIDVETGTSPPTPLEIDALTQTDTSVQVTYVSGGGRRATSLTLLYQIVGIDAAFSHPTPVVLTGHTIGPFSAGQTINLKTRAENSAGAVEGEGKTVAIA